MTKLARSSRCTRGALGTALLATVAILAASCSSSTAPATTSTTAAQTTSTTAASTTSTTAAGGSVANLLNLFKTGQGATFTATYKIMGSGSLTTLTLAQQSSDLLFKGSSASGNFELISLGAKSYICIQQGAAGSWTCYDSGATTASYADMFALYEPKNYLPYFQAAAAAAGGHASYSTKTVGGYTLQCITVSGVKGETGTGTFCVTPQGVLGYVGWSGSGAKAGSFEISSYSATVPASDFTLPATPSKLP